MGLQTPKVLPEKQKEEVVEQGLKVFVPQEQKIKKQSVQADPTSNRFCAIEIILNSQTLGNNNEGGTSQLFSCWEPTTHSRSGQVLV